jgi:hypothetical protein
MPRACDMQGEDQKLVKRFQRVPCPCIILYSYKNTNHQQMHKEFYHQL